MSTPKTLDNEQLRISLHCLLLHLKKNRDIQKVFGLDVPRIPAKIGRNVLFVKKDIYPMRT